jgi:alpha-D-ribose 1-methylphosphonate 5-triphosphate synthase subunit PhnG
MVTLKDRLDADENFEVAEAELGIRDRAERLRKAVKAAGGNRAAATKAGMPLTTLNGYIAGRDMKAAAMIALADACEVSLDWLAKGTAPMKPGQPQPGRAAETRPATLFGSINMDQLGNALLLADAAFSIRKINPDPRQRAQVACIAYDMLNQTATNPATQLTEIMAAIQKAIADGT